MVSRKLVYFWVLVSTTLMQRSPAAAGLTARANFPMKAASAAAPSRLVWNLVPFIVLGPRLFASLDVALNAANQSIPLCDKESRLRNAAVAPGSGR